MATIDVSDYIEAFYNPRRRHSHIGDASPTIAVSAFARAAAFELRHQHLLQGHP